MARLPPSIMAAVQVVPMPSRPWPVRAAFITSRLAVSTAVNGPVVVGRSPNADIVIGAGYVSARHARFTLMGQNLFVEDLGSTNGTAVDGQLIDQPTALSNNDVVNVGDVSIRVRHA